MLGITSCSSGCCLQHDSPKQEGHRDSSAPQRRLQPHQREECGFQGPRSSVHSGPQLHGAKVSFETASTFKPGSILGNRYLAGLFKLTEYVLSNFCVNFFFCSYQSHHSSD